MSTNDLNVGRPSVNVPTTAQAEAVAQNVRTKQTGKTTRGTATDNLTVKRESTGPQYSANMVAAGPELPAPAHVNATDLMAILFGIRQKETESSIESAEQRIHDRSVDKDLKSKEMISKLKKIAHNKPGIGSIFAKVFAWVGVALSFIVAGVIGVVSGGAAAAPLLIIATMSAALLIAQQSGLMEKTMDAMGMDDKAKMGLSLGITVLMLVVNIAAVIASGGASVAGAATQVAESVTEAAATAGEAAAEVGVTAAETATEVSSSVAEATLEASTKATEAIADAATEATEAALETSTKVTESVADAATETTEAAVEASTKVTESVADAATETTEAAVEASTKATESAADAATEAAESTAKTTADAAESAATKAPSAAVKAIAGKLGTSSSRVLRVVDKVSSSVQVARGVTEVSTGGLSINSATKSFQATEARADALRDKAVLTKMQAQNEDDLRRIRNMIEQLERAQNTVMSTISKSDEVALQIRQNI